ncbi:hypothetical protein NDU88_005312 [Pleurodeles waltl]|uniref:Uncharacterized protein n=1 Tax=Pleurodeles waltl TaxID=8319 RepID=A0AAV7UIJ7_PLEWA|nr:hypothetical protein NDU88_005312 [Pleurodeles waltl]
MRAPLRITLPQELRNGKHLLKALKKKAVPGGTQKKGVLRSTHRESVLSDTNGNGISNAGVNTFSDIENDLYEYVFDMTQNDEFNLENEDFESASSKDILRNPLRGRNVFSFHVAIGTFWEIY